MSALVGKGHPVARIVLGLVLAGVAFTAAASFPDVKRYVRMRTM